MKYIFGILVVSLFISSGKTPKKLFEDFHTIYAKSDSVSMKNLLAFNFVGYNENGEVSFERTEYLDYMNTWNQVFKTKWNVESYKVVGDKIESIEYDTDLYKDYFYGTKHQIKYTYRFKKNKIESLTLVTTEEGKKAEKTFDERFAKFYYWVKDTYPEKLRFCTTYDKQAAIEIKKLIEEHSRINDVKI